MAEQIIARNLHLKCPRGAVQCEDLRVSVHAPLQLTGLGMVIESSYEEQDDPEEAEEFRQAFIEMAREWSKFLTFTLTFQLFSGPVRTDVITFDIVTDKTGAPSKYVGNASFLGRDQVMLFPDETYVLKAERGAIDITLDMGLDMRCGLWGRLER